MHDLEKGKNVLNEQNQFLAFIKQITEVPEEQAGKFSTLVSKQEIAEGNYFVRAGERSRNIAFVNRGLFRYYYLSEKGDELTKGFFDTYSVLSAYDAILENGPAHFTIEALENSVIETVDYDRFHQLFSEHPCWNEFLVAMLQKGYLAKVHREREFLLMDASARYKAFLERYPGLEDRVKQHIVASYVGIAPESLSRIRKNHAN